MTGPTAAGAGRRGGRQGWDIQAELRAEYRCHPLPCLAGPEAGGRLGELGYPVHPVVIGDGDGGQAVIRCLGDQVVRGGCAVKEAVRRVAVQLRPRNRLPALALALALARASTRARTLPLASVGRFLPSDRQLGNRAN